MHKFAVIHKPSGVVCYSSNHENHCVAPSFNYEIVNNPADFATITPNLTFNSYAEIVAALSGEFIGFYTDADDTLSISSESHTIKIPALLFQELCLDVEEVAFGDVCELVDDDEYLARKAIQLWVASRLLSTETTTETTEGEEMTGNAATTGIEVVAECLDTYESLEFPNEMVFEYKGDEFLLSDFMYTTEHDGWHGVMGLSYFSAYYVRYENDGSLTLGYAHW